MADHYKYSSKQITRFDGWLEAEHFATLLYSLAVVVGSSWEERRSATAAVLLGVRVATKCLLPFPAAGIGTSGERHSFVAVGPLAPVVAAAVVVTVVFPSVAAD